MWFVEEIVPRANHRLCVEYPATGIKSFAVHPGVMPTEITNLMGSSLPQYMLVDPPSRPSAAIMIALTSGMYDWLSAKYVEPS
jgi:hypothetical protein